MTGAAAEKLASTTARELPQVLAEFIAHAPESCEPLFFGAVHGGGVFKTLVQPFYGAGKHGQLSFALSHTVMT